jgi:hypothetical protein
MIIDSSGGSGTKFVHLPPYDPLWVCALLAGTGVLSFVFHFPPGWVLCLMKFTGFSSLASLMKFSTERTSFAFDFYIFSKASSNLHTTMRGITLSLGQ